MRAVFRSMLNSGTKSTTSWGGRGMSGSTFSPRLVPRAVPPTRKKASSLPSSPPTWCKIASVAPGHTPARSRSMVAASEAPPPRPPAGGMFFVRRIEMPSADSPVRRASNSAARHARFVGSVGVPAANGPSARTPVGPPNLTATSSASSSSWKMVSISWKPSSRTPSTSSTRLTFAGARPRSASGTGAHLVASVEEAKPIRDIQRFGPAHGVDRRHPERLARAVRG